MKFHITPREQAPDILSFASIIWTAADTLRGSSGLKDSEFPDYMMPFFALMLVESRLIRKCYEVWSDPNLLTDEERIEEVKDTAGFYNSQIVEKGITLQKIVMNDTHFVTDFNDYLQAFDSELISLLGIVGGNKTENLNLGGVIESLRKSGILFQYTRSWASIDFTPYNNSEITTLEEHIKRRWADMSAETAGEQYTPDDIISLIASLSSSFDFDGKKIYRVYDMTCGGGNMLFGVEDKIKQTHPKVFIETYGQELRGSLFALAKIESKFRPSSRIEHGNTLTQDKLSDKTFDIGVANPPYGVSWKDEHKHVTRDQTGRFGHGGYPSISDGQLLFVQHMIAKLNENGRSYIVLNGSPLFSGDAGSGESNIRRWILDNDYLEALIQLPNNEFFNTGISTYIWCINKNKPTERKNKVLCINAENEFVKLKKNKGSKNCEMSEANIRRVTNIFRDFEESDISKALSKYDFYYNKQALRKLEKDDTHGAFNQGGDPIKVTNITSVSLVKRDGSESPCVIDLSLLKVKSDADQLNATFKNIDPEEDLLSVTFQENSQSKTYILNPDHCVLLDGENKGYGDILVKVSYKKATTKAPESFVLEVKVSPVWTKDDEKVAYSVDEETNSNKIQSFMKEWVSANEQDYKLLDNTLGVEVNFNSIFPNKIVIRPSKDILVEIQKINQDLGAI